MRGYASKAGFAAVPGLAAVGVQLHSSLRGATANHISRAKMDCFADPAIGAHARCWPAMTISKSRTLLVAPRRRQEVNIVFRGRDDVLGFCPSMLCRPQNRSYSFWVGDTQNSTFAVWSDLLKMRGTPIPRRIRSPGVAWASAPASMKSSLPSSI